MKERTNAQKIHSATRVEIKVDGCDQFIRVTKADLLQLKETLGGWHRFEIEQTFAKALVTVKPA